MRTYRKTNLTKTIRWSLFMLLLSVLAFNEVQGSSSSSSSNHEEKKKDIEITSDESGNENDSEMKRESFNEDETPQHIVEIEFGGVAFLSKFYQELTASDSAEVKKQEFEALFDINKYEEFKANLGEAITLAALQKHKKLIEDIIEACTGKAEIIKSLELPDKGRWEAILKKINERIEQCNQQDIDYEKLMQESLGILQNEFVVPFAAILLLFSVAFLVLYFGLDSPTKDFKDLL